MEPRAVSSSTSKVITTTTSLGGTMAANWGLISLRTSSSFTSCTGRQDSSMLSRAILTILSTTACSMRVNSRPSTLGWEPEPPKTFSTRAKTRRESTTMMALPRKGSILKMLMEVGTGRERMNSPNLVMSMEMGFSSTLLRTALERALVQRRAKRSLTISSTGMRPRMMRSWLARSKGTMPESSSGASVSLSISPPERPRNRASTSSCASTLFMSAPSPRRKVLPQHGVIFL